ncbi:MAG TPA: alpha/beta hydrolase [Candidatus Dormibacteraeota bacterium]|jgi:pimeloyl-ACP methyl ester carboxylesterase|nr:alpha/beta hydrolase [Candidatus Dormibacteraeota bacterium]
MTTFVLVPGAWLGGWAWKKTVPLLSKKGHEAYPVTLTGMGERVHLASKDVGIETAIQDVLNVISYNDVHDFILVGHSFAGKVAAAVADRVPERVRTLLYLDAFRPDKVRTPQGAFDPASEYGPQPAGSLGIPLTERIVDMIGKDLQGPDRKWFLSKGTPWPMRLAREPIILSERFERVKSAYIFCTMSGDPVDEILAGKWGRLEGPHRIMECGHWPMVTKPEELVNDMIGLTS